MSELSKRRQEQVDRVMPLLGNLADRWEQLPNDMKDVLRLCSRAFHDAMAEVAAALEFDD